MPRPGDNPPDHARELFARIGAALYGDDVDTWTRELAKALGVDKRVVQRMRSGEYHHPSAGAWPIPPKVWAELATLLAEYRAQLARELAALPDMEAKAREWAEAPP